MLGFGTWTQHSRRDDQVQAPKFLVSGDVLRGTSTGALGHNFFIARLLVRRKLALGVSVEMRAIASQHEHHQQLGIEPGRRDIVFHKPLVYAVYRLFQLPSLTWQIAITQR